MLENHIIVGFYNVYLLSPSPRRILNSTHFHKASHKAFGILYFQTKFIPLHSIKTIILQFTTRNVPISEYGKLVKVTRNSSMLCFSATKRSSIQDWEALFILALGTFHLKYQHLAPTTNRTTT
jgi:hypothetical protein